MQAIEVGQGTEKHLLLRVTHRCVTTVYPFKYEAQTALFNAPVRTAL